MHNYYQILGISPSASHNDIVNAYRTKCRELLIGDNPIAELTPEQQAVEDAYMVLSDKTRRKQYDIQVGLLTQNPWEQIPGADDAELGFGASLAMYIFIKCFIPFLWVIMILVTIGIVWTIGATIMEFAS